MLSDDDRKHAPTLVRTLDTMFKIFVDNPVTWVRETIATPYRKNYPYYHQKYRRVPTIDQCYQDDFVCIYEAEEQFKRDRKVDGQIVSILRLRKEDCTFEERPDHEEKCQKLIEAYNTAVNDYFIKYGDLAPNYHVVSAYMKQKHRMLWERRHGPVGSGMKNERGSQ